MIYSINMHTTVYQFWRFVYHNEQSVIDHYARISLYTLSFWTKIRLHVYHLSWPQTSLSQKGTYSWTLDTILFHIGTSSGKTGTKLTFLNNKTCSEDRSNWFLIRHLFRWTGHGCMYCYCIYKVFIKNCVFPNPMHNAAAPPTYRLTPPLLLTLSTVTANFMHNRQEKGRWQNTKNSWVKNYNFSLTHCI